MAEHEHLVNTIFIGEVATVQSYGAFVRIPGISKQGLIHRSQVSSAPVDDVSDVLNRGDRVYCKVISVTDGKIALSMKLVNQGSGKDLDPNGVQLQKDELRRKNFVPGNRKKIELEAVLNTTCSKCGTRGHMARDCFKSPDGKVYDLLPDEDEGMAGSKGGEDGLKESEGLPDSDHKAVEKKMKKKKKEKKTKLCKEKKRKKSKKKKSRKSSTDDSSSSEVSSSSERETELRRKKCKRSHSSSSSDEGGSKKRRKHSNAKKKKSRK